MCWLQLMMCKAWPLKRASIWHTVVLPVPVSPTSSAGSLCCKHLQHIHMTISSKAAEPGSLPMTNLVMQPSRGVRLA